MRNLARNLASALFALALPFAYVACGDDKEDNKQVDVPVTGLTLPSATLDVLVGVPATITATVAPDGATNKAVVWDSSDVTVVAKPTAETTTVTINALKVGETVIKVTSKADDTKSASCTVTARAPIPVDSVSLDKRTMQLRLGDVVQGTLAATVLPADAADKSVDWSNLDPTIATIAWSGASATVTAVAPGQTTVAVASVSDPSKKDECVVTVLPATPAVGAARSTFAAGDVHSAAIKADGGIYTWGRNQMGQLGTGDLINKSSPFQIGSEKDWATVSAYNHTLAVKVNGNLWAWGSNASGKLGVGDEIYRESPYPVSSTNWSIVSAGIFHTLAIKEDGSLWAWGSNTYGQLGLGAGVPGQVSPVRVDTEAWTAVAAGYQHSLGIRADGGLYVWGNNDYGQLGLGEALPFQPAPVRVGTDSWTAVSAGYNTSAAIKEDGSLWAWGNDLYGQLGVGGGGTDWEHHNRNAPARVGTDSNWAAVSTGLTHTMALKLDGSLWACGNNYYGQLGNPAYDTYPYPNTLVRVGTDTWAAVSVSSGGGGRHTLAIKVDGGLWAWGNNEYGQLGLGDDGEDTHRYEPTLVGTGFLVPAK